MHTYGIEQSISSWYGMLIMGLLACMSVYLLAVFFVRILFFRGIRMDSAKLLQQVQTALASKDAKTLSELKGHGASDPPVRIMVGVGLSNRDLDEAELSELLKITQIRQKARLEKGLPSFGTFATIGPFMGLLATVLGIIESFHNLAETGAAGPNVVASGVAAALWGTAAGLFLAIPSVIAYNIFNKKAKAVAMDMEIAARELLLLFKVEKHSRSR